jgi:hypothetical protein
VQQDSLLPVSPQAPIHKEKEGSEKEADAQSCMQSFPFMGVHTLSGSPVSTISSGFLVAARSMDIKDAPGASRSRSRSPEAAARQPPTMRVTRSCSRGRVFSISKEELHLNYWFRNGPGHNFEDGVQYVESWQGKAEEEVLLDRAARKVKPVACVVLNNYGKKDQRRIRRLCREHRLHYHSIRNEWGIDVLYATATPSTTLGTLLAGRADCQAQGLTLEDAVSRRHIQWYFTRGFDLASNPSMGVLESALLYGYPTELHGKEDIWNEFESIWQLKL